MTAEEWLKDKLPFNAINVMEDDEVQNTVSIPLLLEDYAQFYHAEMSKWVRVEDALPEIHERVLVWAKEGHGTIASYWTAIYLGNNYFSSSTHSDNITHWQPLPPKPNEI